MLEQNSFGKKAIQVYLNKIEWDMLEGLHKDTNAETKPDVLRAALIRYYNYVSDTKEKEKMIDE